MDPSEQNAVAWLSLTDVELMERSASVGLPASLSLEPEPGTTPPTQAQIDEARQTADDNARDHAGDVFVDDWIAQNR